MRRQWRGLLDKAGLWSILAIASPAAVADCAPLGHIASFNADAPVTAEYDFHDYPNGKGDPVRVKGRSCAAHYALKAGSPEPTPQDNVKFYKQQFAQLGARLVMDDGNQAVAVLNKNGVETWMHVASEGGWGSGYFINVVDKGVFKPSLTAPAANDYRLLGHMPGYVVNITDKKANDEDQFVLAPNTEPVKAQGFRIGLSYLPSGRPKSAADLEVLDNYALAINNLGGRVLAQNEHSLAALLEDKGQQIWVRLYVQGDAIALNVLEEQAFQAPRLDDLKATLDKTGRLVLYINFDFAKASLKPDATAVIAQVVALLKANPAYRIAVNGHTDNIGGADGNKKLSEARAASVADTLAANGVDKARLSSAGFGAANPIADNATTLGRAKNRRVELVKK